MVRDEYSELLEDRKPATKDNDRDGALAVMQSLRRSQTCRRPVPERSNEGQSITHIRIILKPRSFPPLYCPAQSPPFQTPDLLSRLSFPAYWHKQHFMTSNNNTAIKIATHIPPVQWNHHQ